MVLVMPIVLSQLRVYLYLGRWLCAAGMSESDAAACVVYVPLRCSCLSVSWKLMSQRVRRAVEFDSAQSTFQPISSERLAALLENCALNRSSASAGGL